MNVAGYGASFLVFRAFYMKAMVPLRVIAIASNLAFVVYGLGHQLYPVLILHTLLLPVNCLRLVQMWRLTRRVRHASRGDLSIEWLIPLMTRHQYRSGDVMFRMGDPARAMFVILCGSVRMVEIGAAFGARLGHRRDRRVRPGLLSDRHRRVRDRGGGGILAFPDRYVGLFLAFQSQRIPTDAAGNAASGSVPLSQILVAGPPAPAPVPTPVPAPTPTPVPAPVPSPLRATVYIERALINPSGADQGREVVVLSSRSTKAQTLTNWRLIDKNGRITPLNVTIGPGQSALVALDGNGVQLGNNGGTVTLHDSQNVQVDVVTYTAADAGSDDRFVRFHH